MSQNRAQTPHAKAGTTEEDRASREAPITVVGYYMRLLALALMMLVTLYSYPIVFLTNLRMILEVMGTGAGTIALLTRLMAVLSTPFAILFGWVFAGLCVCALLRLCLKSQRAATAVTLLLTLVWIVAVFRHAQGEYTPPMIGYMFQAFGIPTSIISSLILSVLAIGVPILPVAWFVRPLEPRGAGGNPLTRNMSLTVLTGGWLLTCLLLIFGFREYRAGTLLFVYLVASGVVFLWGLYLTSGFLLPTGEKSHRSKIFGFLRDIAMGVNFPAYIVVDELYEEDKLERRVTGNPFAGGGLTGLRPTGSGFVISGCDHAVAISDGIEFKGVQGPGVTFTRYADQVVQTVDLRPQLRTFHVEALTKDGIKIRVLAFTPCRIDSRGRRPALGEPLPHNKSAAFRAIHAQRTEHKGVETEQLKWYELPRVIAERILQNIISEYTFDDLYGPYQPGGEPPRVVIARRFCEQLDEELEPLGIHRVGGGISNLEPADPKVYLERARSWQAEWLRAITLRRAEGQAEWLRTVERARAEAQADLILSLGRQLETLGAEKTEFRPEAALKLLLSTLDRMMQQQPALGQLLPGETLKALLDIRRSIPG